MYESLATCPDDLLLFLHHVPYTYMLHSGKTVIQSIYDSHYEGAEAVEGYVREWKSLKGLIDEQRYDDGSGATGVSGRAGGSVARCGDQLVREGSGIADAKGRVGHYPGRFEAESMTLEGYTVREVTPAEDASGGKAVACAAPSCTATLRYQGEPGWYTLRVEYFDQNDGVSHYRLWIGRQLVDEWAADLRLPTRRLDSTSSTRRQITGIALRPGDQIRMEGVPDGGETAALDYVEIVPER